MNSVTRIAVLAGSLLLGFPAFPISRVGTCGVTDPVEGFSVPEVPMGFRDIHPLALSGVQLAGLGTIDVVLGGFNSASPVERILIYPLRNDYPELLNLNRQDFDTHFPALGPQWQKQSVSNLCLSVWTVTNESLRTTIVGWGGGKGLVIQSEFKANTDVVVQQFVESIQLEPGACTW